MQCIALAGVGLIGILAFTRAVAAYNAGAEAAGIVIAFSVYMIALFIFEIWTIIVAKRARQEIAGEADLTNDTNMPKV